MTFNGQSSLFGTIQSKGNLTFNGKAAVTDINRSPFINSGDSVTVEENFVGTVYTGTGLDPNVGDILTWSLAGTDQNLFTIDPLSGAIVFKQPPDYEKPADSDLNNVYQATVTVTDKGGLSGSKPIVINVTNVNEAPTDIALDNNTVDENAVGAVIGNLTVTDPDTEAAFLNNTITVSDDRFEVLNTNGTLQLKLKDGQSLDYETEQTVSLTLTATDAGDSSLTYSENFTINVTNVNEVPNDIALDNNTVDENAVGAVIGNVTITDPDTEVAFLNNTITVSDDRFEVVNTNGTLQLKLKDGQSLDYEAEQTVSLTLTATDAGDSSLTYSENFTINVTNVNEVPTDIALDNNTVDENAVGAVIGNVTITDPDTEAAFLNNTVTVNDDRFEVVNTNGTLQLKLKDGLSLDYETGPTVSLTLTATDAGDNSLTYSENFTISVTDIIEAPPTLTAQLLNDTGVNQSDRITIDPTIAGVTANATSLQGNLNGNGFVDISDALNGDGSFTISFEQYDALSNGNLPNGEYTLELRAGNSSGQESELVTVSFILDLSPPPLTLQLAPESDTGELGDNKTTNYQVNLIGTTEPGLEVILVETQQKAIADENGNFTFTDVPMPSAGEVPYTVVVADEVGNGNNARQFLTREGFNGAPEITSSPETVLDTTQQTTYTYQVVATDPDNDDLTYTLLNAPQGAEIDENGLISFIPSGTLQPYYDFTVEVSDGRGGTDTQVFTVELPTISATLGTIRGMKWEDINKNGIKDVDISSEEIELVNNFSQAYYNNKIGDLYPGNPTNPLASYFPGPNISTGQPTADFSIEPDLSSINELGSWLSDPESAIQNGFWSDLQSIPRSWSVNTETAIIYQVDGGEYGVKNLIADFVVDNSILVWVNGEYQFGIGNPPGFRVNDVPLGDLNPGKNYIQIIRADYGVRTNYSVTITGNPIEQIAEPGLAGVSVYLDANNNGVLDPGEPVQVTAEDDPNTTDIDETGKYKFTNLLPSTYTVREIVPQGFTQTFPSTQSHTVTLDAGEVVENIDFGNARVGTVNVAPRIVSNPITTGYIGVPYQYQVAARDANGDSLTYSLINAPDGMEISDTGLISWTTGAIGNYQVEVQVDDGKGGIVSQLYDLNVAEVPVDEEAPEVALGFSGTVLSVGETVNFQISGQDNFGLADLDISFNGESLTLNPANIERGTIYTASFTPDKPGIFEVLATATDFRGNQDTETLSIRVLDPDDTSAPIAQLDISDFDPLNLVIREKTEIKGTINDENLEFYRVELAPVSLVDLSNPAAKDPDYITIAEGTGNIDGVLASIDPALYRNDNYFVRIYAQDINGNVTVEGFGVGIDSQTKPGEFSLDFTDLSIPLTGIPIEITRSYSSLDANFQGDFGYGWDLGLQDAQIVESAPTGVDLTFDDFFGGNSFTEGTRVTLTTPDGRRVGFTFTPEVFSPSAGIFLGPDYYAWRPKFTPDPGVYETLEVPYTPIMRLPDGSFGLYLFGFTYNPGDYILTTKDGTKYTYNQDLGLQNVLDRNGNKLTYTDNGIFSSTGAKIDFIRDAQGRITEIIDPDGQSLKYNYDTEGDLVGFIDRTNNQTTFEYESDRPHYLTEMIDPLGRTGVRTEYDENGQISKIFDADGNALDINYDSAASRQTVKDPFGNTITRIFDGRGNVVQEIDQLGGITQRTYDANNNLLSEIDPEGNTMSYTYDSRGNKLSETDGEGNTKTYTYNSRNDILTETDALGNLTTYTYDVNGNLTSRQDALGNVTTYKYGQYGLLTEVVDANGKTSTFSYDGYGNLTALVDPTGATTTFTYDGNGRVASVTDALGAITNYVYDAQGRLIEKADPEGSSCGCARGITKTEYNAAGEKIAEIDALGRRTEYRYSDRGLLIETILPDATPLDLSDNPRTKNEYDPADRLIVTVDELGRQTHYIYDKLGRQIETIFPDATPDDLSDNPRTQKEYDSAGRVIAEIDELGNRTEFDYDKADRLIARTNALGEVTSYIYDADGRQIAMTDALGRTTNYAYDALDRLISTTYANNAVMTTTYDALGRVVAQTDLAGITTNYEYDALGRLTAVVDALNQRTEYKYDAVGNLIEQKDANGHITQFEYDSLRRRKATILPGGQRNETIHDKIGNLIRVTDFNGVKTTYEYNERNWLTEKSFSDGTPTETFTYTLTGELATVTDNRGVTSYLYDERDRLLSRTEPDNRQIQYTYDAAGNILSLIVPSGTTAYTYDALNRIDTVIDPDSGVTDYTYDAVGNLIKTEFPNGIEENQQYDLLNRLTYLENRNQTGILSSYTYTLDAMGNRTKVVENDGRTVEYSYDQLYRLTQEKITDPVAGNKVIDYKFDPVGNRLERIDSVEGTTTYTYDANDRLLEEVLGGKVTQYQYDAEGNLTAKVENGQTQAEYEWNAKGELVAVEVTENGETGRIEFEYDHQGIRVAIKQNGEETRFLIDKNQQEYAQVIEEYQVNGTVDKSYVHGIDLISQENANGRTYYQVDGLGSTRLLTDNNGAIVVEYDYDAYGNLTRKVGDADNNYLFAGEQFDEAVDGYYLRARYYDPATGRFVSTDPFEGYNNQPVTLHDYLYGNINPVNFIDPSGEVALIDKVLIYIGVTGAVTAATNVVLYLSCKGYDNGIYKEAFLGLITVPAFGVFAVKAFAKAGLALFTDGGNLSNFLANFGATFVNEFSAINSLFKYCVNFDINERR
jgi:RHS repeat-associated protein